MKNIFLSAALALAALATTCTASAQSGYTFTKVSQPYTTLTGATSLSKNSLWTSDTIFSAPIGFNFKMAGTTISSIHLWAGNFAASTRKTAVGSGFIMLGTGLMDRGQNWMTARSDIRYQTTGTTGSRVFKLEIYNAGFEDEFFKNGELKDSISLQLWLFEGTNVAEFHYGTSMVSNFSDYFGSLMRSGYIRNLDTGTGTFEKFYVVNGSAASPTLDSATSFSGTKGLSSVPVSGTVFRFTPKGNASTGIGQVPSGTLAKVYPTQCNGFLYIEHSNGTALDYSIAGLNGQAVAQGSAVNGRTTIDLSNVPAGVYTVRLSEPASRTYEGMKIIKQ